MILYKTRILTPTFERYRYNLKCMGAPNKKIPLVPAEGSVEAKGISDRLEVDHAGRNSSSYSF